MIIKKFIIANSGINKNNVILSKEVLKKVVDNIKKDSIVITDEFDHSKDVLGYMKNLEYKQGKILADIYTEKEIPVDKCVRCSYFVFKTSGKDPIEIKDCDLIEGAIIEKKKDAERDLL